MSRRLSSSACAASVPPSAGDVDKEKLRGLSMIGRGIRGAQRGTDPMSGTIKRAERRGL